MLLITVASALFGVLYGVVLAEGVRFGLINGLLNGLVIALLDCLWVRKRRGRRLRRLPLLSYTLVLTAIWTLVIVANMALVRHWLGLEHDLRLQWMQSEAFWRHFLFCLFMAFTFNLLLRISAFLGSRSLIEILLGRYQEPAEQQLAFLFLDVVGSTRLTEQVGDARTQSLIGELFFEIAGLVDQYGGEVHRYIGDEMVITWGLAPEKPTPDVLGCLQQVFALVEQHRQRTEPELGIWIDLRAGANAGPVLVSEVGDQKRELVYFGDAINIAAGLQRHCKQVKRRALIAAPFYESLPKPLDLVATQLGPVWMKGKNNQVDCVALFAG